MNQAAKTGKHPKGLMVLFFTEMWERFGYYLMVGILLLYLISDTGKDMPRAMGADIVGTFIALVYLTPFIGGLIADRYLGYIKSIFLGGSLMATGYLLLALPDDIAMYIGLGCIIIGNGFFKPNISTLLGNMYNTEELRPLKDNAYNIFYMGINIGALICNFAAAILRNRIGWGAAFSAAGIGLIIGLIWLAFNLKHVKQYDVKKPMQAGDMPLSRILSSVFLPMIIFGIIGWVIPGNLMGSDSNDAFVLACVPVIYFYTNLWRKGSVEDKKGIGALLFIFAISIIFWTIYNQNSTGLTIWAESHTDRSIPKFMEKPADAVYTLQNLTTELRVTDSMDQYMRVVTDTAGNPVKSMAADPYFVNMPKDKWPSTGVAKVGNTELFQSINPFFIVAFTPLLIMFFAYMARRGKPVSTARKFAWALIISG
ncbi:MAG TPA: peptide MFS transporter, partial [Chitinophagaceae bacterium]|nr:peptide MFS transporter [Chitinophagaceae bacterium]